MYKKHHIIVNFAVFPFFAPLGLQQGLLEKVYRSNCANTISADTDI